jgi:hypothetical protein
METIMEQANNTAAANDPTMDLQEAANFLHLGYKAMKELVDSGDVPALSLNQKHTVLLREDLITYVREQGRKLAEKRWQGKQAEMLSLQPAPPSRGNKMALPNLDPYELTTSGRRG